MQGQMRAVWRKIRNRPTSGGGFHGILTLHIPAFPRILMNILKPPRKGANVMLKSIYLQQVYSDLVARDPEQKEFHQAVREVLESLDLMIDSHPEYREAALLDLSNGGRGIGNQVESLLINPLSRWLFDHEVLADAQVVLEDFDLAARPPCVCCRLKEEDCHA